MTERRFWTLSLTTLTVLTLLLGGVANHYVNTQWRKGVETRLLLVNNLRREAISRYLATAEAELRFWSTNREMLGYQRFLSMVWSGAEADGDSAAQTLRSAYIPASTEPLFTADGFDNDSAYDTVHAQLHPLAGKFVTERGYYDLFLIDAAGNIAYTVEKEDDFATNLLTGPYRDTGLGDVFRRALAGSHNGAVAYSDIKAYAPSAGDPAMFMATAMRYADGSPMGVLALQLPIDRIADIMSLKTEAEKVIATYLVGADRRLRIGTTSMGVETLGASSMDTEAVTLALNSEQGVIQTQTASGELVFSAYSGLAIDQHRWAVLVDISRAAMQGIAREKSGWLLGVLGFVYALGIWSLWFLRGADMGADAVLLGLKGGIDSTD